MANRVALSVQVGAKASRIRVLNTWKLSLLRLHSSRSLVLFQQCCSLLFQQRRPFELMMCAQHLEFVFYRSDSDNLVPRVLSPLTAWGIFKHFFPTAKLIWRHFSNTFYCEILTRTEEIRWTTTWRHISSTDGNKYSVLSIPFKSDLTCELRTCAFNGLCVIQNES